MNLAQVDVAPVCPWKNTAEWLTVYHQVLSTETVDWEAALHTLTRWVNLRDSVPAHVAASVPVVRARCLLYSTHGQTTSSPELPAGGTPALMANWAVRIAVIEFVNIFVKGVEAECAFKGKQANLLQQADEAGLPRDLIPLRNSLVHSTDISATVFMQTQVVECMWQFLKTKYWDTEHLLLRRRLELLQHAKKRCASVVTTTGDLRQHLYAISEAVRSNDPNKTGLSGAPDLFLKLKEVTIECLEYVHAFTSEGKDWGQDRRTQEVVRILVEELLLSPPFVKFLHKRRDSCTCGCPLHVDRVPLRKLLVFLLAQNPQYKWRQEGGHKDSSLADHLFCVLLEHVAPDSNAQSAAFEWLQLLLSNCTPEAFPPAGSCLKCPHHNLFLSPVRLEEVPAPQTACSLRGSAVPQLTWSVVIWGMSASEVTDLEEEARRLLPLCVTAAMCQPVESRETESLLVLRRALQHGGRVLMKKCNSMAPNERVAAREAREEGWETIKERTLTLLQRQLAMSGPDGGVKPCMPLGYTAPSANIAAESALSPSASSAPDTKENRVSSLES